MPTAAREASDCLALVLKELLPLAHGQHSWLERSCHPFSTYSRSATEVWRL